MHCDELFDHPERPVTHVFIVIVTSVTLETKEPSRGFSCCLLSFHLVVLFLSSFFLRLLPSLCLASAKSRLVLPFWYWLTRVVPDRGPLNVYSSFSSGILCRAGSMHLSAIRLFVCPSLCLSMGPQQQICCCKFASAARPARDISQLLQTNADSVTLSAHVGS